MASPKLKRIDQQVIVLTGATSGIGLATARLASERGASLLLVARNEDALSELCGELRAKGGRAEYAVADVADHAQVQATADRAVSVYGGFDTWVNDAGAFIYGAIEDVKLDDQRRLFDVVYWGLVYGTLVASAHLKAAGGAIVNVGSVLGEFAIPYQGPYCAAKFAVKGFTEAFRREMAAAKHPISITLIKPAAINTAFMEHARNAIGSPGTRNPPPAYDPLLVARAILHSAEHRARDITIGGAGGLSLVLANQAVPRVMDWVFASVGKFTQTTHNQGDLAQRDNLYDVREDMHERSTLHPLTRKTSMLLEAQLNPAATALVAGLGMLLLGAAARSTRKQSFFEKKDQKAFTSGLHRHPL